MSVIRGGTTKVTHIWNSKVARRPASGSLTLGFRILSQSAIMITQRSNQNISLYVHWRWNTPRNLTSNMLNARNITSAIYRKLHNTAGPWAKCDHTQANLIG